MRWTLPSVDMFFHCTSSFGSPFISKDLHVGHSKLSVTGTLALSSPGQPCKGISYRARTLGLIEPSTSNVSDGLWYDLVRPYELRTLRQMAGNHAVWGAWLSMRCAASLLTDDPCAYKPSLSYTTTDLAAILLPNRINRESLPAG